MDKKRLKIMDKVLKQAGTTCVKTYHQDFLSVEPDNPSYSQIKYIIVDPSCSGSGTFTVLE